MTGRAERLKFVLASYNVGLGHVEDAVPPRRRRTATTPASWENVAYWLIRKSKRDIYNDPVVKYGFARGTEPVGYVDAILTRWDHYREFVSDQPAPEATPSLGPEATPVPEATPTPGRR